MNVIYARQTFQLILFTYPFQSSVVVRICFEQGWQSHRIVIQIASHYTFFPKKITSINRIKTHKKIASVIASQNWIKTNCDYFDFLIKCLPYFTWLWVATVSSS